MIFFRLQYFLYISKGIKKANYYTPRQKWPYSNINEKLKRREENVKELFTDERITNWSKRDSHNTR